MSDTNDLVRLEIDLKGASGGGTIAKMIPAEHGDYVRYSDYERLKRENAMLREGADSTDDRIQWLASYENVRRENQRLQRENENAHHINMKVNDKNAILQGDIAELEARPEVAKGYTEEIDRLQQRIEELEHEIEKRDSVINTLFQDSKRFETAKLMIAEYESAFERISRIAPDYTGACADIARTELERIRGMK